MRCEIRKKKTFGALLLLCIAFTALHAQARVLSPVPEGVVVRQVFPHERRLAFVVEKDSMQYLCIEENRFGPYEYVSDFRWAPDGERYAYVALLDGKRYIHTDTERLGPFDNGKQPVPTMFWTADGRDLIYTQVIDGSYYHWIGANREGPFRRIEYIYSPDRSRVATVCIDARSNNVIFLDRERMGPFRSVVDFTWSPDGSTYAFSAGTGDFPLTFHVHTEEAMYGPYGPVRIYWSPDCSTIAYQSNENGTRVFYRNGEILGSMPNEESWSPMCVSSKGTVAYKTRLDGKQYIVAGERRYGPYERIHSMEWSPDGSTLAYVSMADGVWRVHAGEKTISPVGMVNTLLWSPDGSTLTFISAERQGSKLYAGSRMFGPYETVFKPVWSPDGTCLTFLSICEDGSRFFWTGDRFLPSIWDYDGQIWSPDGKTCYFKTLWVRKDNVNTAFSKVLRNGELYTGGLYGNRVVYVKDGSFVEE